MSHNYSKIARVLLFAAAATMAMAAPVCAQSRPRRVAAGQSQTRIQWSGTTGVARYRLQVARDEQFTDIVLDRAVTLDPNAMTHDYSLTDLPAGVYYWRVAPATGETGKYSEAASVQITDTPVEGIAHSTGGVALLLSPPADVGWRTATGDVLQPIAAHLRDASSYDLVGVNADGTVYALNGTNGVALWTTRFNPKARRHEQTSHSSATNFTPFVFTSTQKSLANLVVAFEGGVRALDGATGRELWRAALSGRAASGISVDLDGDGTPEIVITDDATPSLTILKSDTGRIVSQTKLSAAAIGNPAALNINNERAVALSIADGSIDTRDINGKQLGHVMLDAAITTAPLVAESARGAVLMVGTGKGLIALNGADLQLLWRVATENNEAPRGKLVAADLEKNGAAAVVMITTLSRVVAINYTSGKIKWSAEGATDASAAAFADLNEDGVLDVIVAARPAFAVGLSGRDGSLIWKAEDAGQPRQSQNDNGSNYFRTLVAAPLNTGSAFIVGTDPTYTTLRAVGLPRGAGLVAFK